MSLVFSNETALEDYIRDHTTEIFGEVIHWNDARRELPGEYTPETGKPIKADLVGTDEKKAHLIVEVKLLRPTTEQKYDRAREAVGQVLHYTYAYLARDTRSDADVRYLTEHVMRLFIVGEAFSQPVENMCRLLRAFGFNIQHLYVNKQGEPE